MIALIIQGVVTYFIVCWLFRKLERQLGCSVIRAERCPGTPTGSQENGYRVSSRRSPSTTEQPRYRSNVIKFGRKHG